MRLTWDQGAAMGLMLFRSPGKQQSRAVKLERARSIPQAVLSE